MPSPEKFRETLDDFEVGQSIIDEMYQGFDGIVSKTNKKVKSTFFKQALDVMNEKLPLSITAWTRLGETQALHWSDYKDDEIYVHRNIIKVRKDVDPKCFIEVSTKTKKGKRHIKLPPNVCELLNELKDKQSQIPGFNDDWYIFNRWDGNKYLDGYIPVARTIIQRRFEEGIKKSGVRKIRIHDLRHSGATYAIISGEDIKAVSERLGHEDIDTTLRVYHHVIEKTKSKVMENTSDFARICQE